MNYSNLIAWIAMLGIMSVGAPSIAAQVGGHLEGSHTMLSPADLKWVDVPSLPPGAKLAIIEGPPTEAVPFTFRLQFPANYQIPAHWHPAVERVTVISGTTTWEFETSWIGERRKPYVLEAWRLCKLRRITSCGPKEETVVLNGTGPRGITYFNPADDPRKN